MPTRPKRYSRPAPKLPANLDQVCVIVELVELAAARERRAANAVLRPAAAGAYADIPVQPHGSVDRPDPTQPPVRSAHGVQIGGAREAAERTTEGEAIGPGVIRRRGRGAGLGAERGGRERPNEHRSDEGQRTRRHKLLHKEKGFGVQTSLDDGRQFMNELYFRKVPGELWRPPGSFVQ